MVRDESTFLGLLDDVSRVAVEGVLALDNWDEALSKFDRYPWVRLFPIHVHIEFAIRVFSAVNARTTNQQILNKWAKACDHKA
jgi:hypothetical protein